jgi:hypothetical protein
MLPPVGGDVEMLVACVLSRFRASLYGLLTSRADALFEAVDAVLCGGAPASFAEVSLDPVFRRGHGALYDALACGGIDGAGLDRLLAGRFAAESGEGLPMVAFDVTLLPRPDAETSPERTFGHLSGRGASARVEAGWQYSLAVGLEWGATSWTAPLSARRLGPAEDPTETAWQHLCQVNADLIRPDGWLAVFDAGYDLPRLSFLRDRERLPVQILGRVRANRVFHYRARPKPGATGRPPSHGARFVLAEPATHPATDAHSSADSPRYGHVDVDAWHHLHPKLGRDGSWTMARHPGPLPIIEGTLIRITPERLPGNRNPEAMWLWHHGPDGIGFDLDLLWMAYLRRFDIEHTIKFCKRQLGWGLPKIRTPRQQDLWTRLVLAAHTQLRLARTLAADLPRPWQRATRPGRVLTPGRVLRGFRGLAGYLGTPASPPKPGKAGPGRPAGTIRPPRQRFPVNKKPPIAEKRARERSRTRRTKDAKNPDTINRG